MKSSSPYKQATAPLLLMSLLIGAGLLSISASSEKISHPLRTATSIDSATEEPQNFQNCGDAPSSVEQEACVQDLYDASTKKLNEIYLSMQNQLKSKITRDMNLMKAHPNSPIIKDKSQIDHDTQTRLTFSQRAWMQFREANCNLVAATDLGGSGEGIMNITCLNSTTLERISELERISQDLFDREK